MSRFKFELPAIKGTELWPKQIQAPANVRIGFEFPARFASASKSYLENLAQRLMDQRAGTISHYIQAQRRNYHLGVTEVAATHREIDGLFMAYNNIQGVHETVDLKFTVSEEQIAQIETQPQFQNKLHEHELEQLFMVVFYEGNQVAAIPMSALKSNSFAPRYRRRLQNSLESKYGEIRNYIKTMQLKINKQHSVIYSELSGLTTSQISRSETYVLTSNALLGEATTDSPTVYEYPILDYTGNTISVSLGAASIDERGRIHYTPGSVMKSLDGATGYPAYAVVGSERHYAAEISVTEFMAFSGVFCVACDGFTEFSAPSTMPDEYPKEVFPPDKSQIAGDNIYSTLYSDVDELIPAGIPSGSWWLDQRSSYEIECINGSWQHKEFYESSTWGIVSDGSHSFGVPVASYQAINKIDYLITTLTPVNYAYHSDNNDGWLWSASASYGPFSGSSGGSQAAPIGGGDVYLNGGVNYSFAHFPFPPAVNGRLWAAMMTVTYPGGLVEWRLSPTTVQITTPYGDFSGSGLFTDTGTMVGPFHGWLHVSNGEHYLQGFKMAKQKYLYLDGHSVGGQLAGALKTSLDSIQTVLFDIPLKAFNKFK